MKTRDFAALASALFSLVRHSPAEPSTISPRSERVTITKVDAARSLLTVTGDGFRETIDAHMADIRFRHPSGRTAKRTVADILPGMTATVTAHWGTATLATKIVVHTK